MRSRVRSGLSAPSLRQFIVPCVTLDAVSKVFQEPRGASVCAVSDLSLAIEDGECLAMVGPSGSGKTTALRLIAGLEIATSGTISIGGKVVNSVAPGEREVAMVFQSPALYPHLSVYDNLGFGLRLRRWSRREADQRIRQVAALLGLTPFLDSLPGALSGGQRQRVAIGRALARRPGVLLMDEPLANIDPALRAQLRSELSGLHRNLGTTLVYVTHDHLEAMLIGDRVAVLRQGMLQQVGPPLSLYQRPANLFVAGFVGAWPANLFSGVLSTQGDHWVFRVQKPAPDTPPEAAQHSVPLVFPPGMPAVLQAWRDKPIVLAVRPEHIYPANNGIPGSSAAIFAARVTSVENTGPDLYLHATCWGTRFVARVPPNLPVRPGHDCAFQINTAGCSWFDARTGKAIAAQCAC